jgi:hypothetical protein
VEVWWKSKAKAEQKIKVLIEKLKDKNEEFKGSIAWLKSQNEEL